MPDNPLSRSPLRRLTPAAALLLALSLAACASPAAQSDAAGSPEPGGSLTFAIDVAPDCFDPHVSPADITAAIQRNVYDSLVAQGENGEFEPWLAESWEISEDGTAYTFQLRQDVVFHDGTPFDADAVKANLDRIVDPGTASQYASTLIQEYDSTEVVDEHTVTVRLASPYAPFLQALSTTYLGLRSPESIRASGGDLCNGGDSQVGSGAFRFTEYTQGQRAVFTRNDDYAWAPGTAEHEGPAYLDELVVTFVPESAVRTGSLTSGEAHVIDQVPAADIDALTAGGGISLISQDAPGAGYTYFLNTTREPFSDRRARLAVQRAVDFGQITETLYHGHYERAWSPLTPTTFGYDPTLEQTWPHEPDGASDLLDELGYTERDAEGYRTRDGERFSIELLYDPTYQREDRITYDTAVQDQLQDAGIELVITPLGDGTYVPVRNEGDYDTIAFAWGRADPDLLRSLYHSDSQLADGGANGARLSDPEIDTWLDAGLTEQDTATRAEHYARVQRRIVEEGYALPAFVQPRYIATASGVHGLAFDPSAWPLFHGVWLSGGGD